MGWYGPVGGLLDYSFVELMLGSKINGQDVQLETQVVPYKCRGSDSRTAALFISSAFLNFFW
jgi:hypothetical protein